MTPSVYIAGLSENIPNAKEYYLNGGCYKFYKLLESKYPSAEAYYDGNHVITKIDGEYYDITGKVEKGNHIRMTREQQDDAETWQKENEMADTLNTETVKTLAEILGVDESTITNSLTGDGKLELQGQYFTTDQLNSRDGVKYQEGKKAGEEMMVKGLKEKYSYDFDGKDMETFMSHHNSQLEVKYSSSDEERITELKKSIETQKQTYEGELTQLRQQNESLQSNVKKQGLNNKLLNIMPKETLIGRDAILTLFHSQHTIEEQDGKEVFLRNGNKLIDPKTTEPIAADVVFNEWVVENKYAKPPSGRGGGNETGGGENIIKADNPNDFQEKWLKANPGKNPNSPEYLNDYKEFRDAQKSA